MIKACIYILILIGMLHHVVAFRFGLSNFQLHSPLKQSSGWMQPKHATSCIKDSKQLFLSMSSQDLDEDVRNRIDNLVKANKVVLFMKGNKLFPQCGFSNTACRILQALNTQFEAVNVLEDDRIRNGIKIYSSWPTIPQLYIGGEFVGGSDIMVELYNNGQLAEMIEVANAN